MTTTFLEPQIASKSSEHPATMQAAVVEEIGRPLVLREFERPTAGQGQIVVKTEACGVCHKDLYAVKLAHARVMGANLNFNVKTCEPVAELKKQTGGGAHGVLITAPSLPAFKQGIAMTRKLSTCALVGLPPGDFLCCSSM